MAKKRKKNIPKKNIPKNGNTNYQRRRKQSEIITVEGKTYAKLYDDNGAMPEALRGFSEAGLEDSIKELTATGLMEIIERNGIRYYRLPQEDI